jgi:hypothetical protein
MHSVYTCLARLAHSSMQVAKRWADLPDDDKEEFIELHNADKER